MTNLMSVKISLNGPEITNILAYISCGKESDDSNLLFIATWKEKDSTFMEKSRLITHFCNNSKQNINLNCTNICCAYSEEYSLCPKI